jgi:Ser/Thr protein kinase RdoA (MazF antagonist)
MFPTIHSIASPEALAADINARFDIGEVVECKFYSGGFNDTYRLRTKTRKVFYLRIYRIPWRMLADIQYELDVLNHLKQKGFAVANPVASRTGAFYWTLQAAEGDRHAALFYEAPGFEISYDREPAEIAYRYGLAVARMHNALDDFSSKHSRFHLDLDHLIDRPLQNIAPFLAHRPADWTYLCDFAGKLRQRILDLPADELEKGFCHGDLQGYHAMVDPDGTLTFFDFDCGGFGFRAYDLAVFLWCCRLQDAVEARWEPYQRGYQESRPIHSLDLEAVPLFVCCRYLWHMGVHTQNAPDWGCGWLNAEYFENRLAQLRQAEADYLPH